MPRPPATTTPRLIFVAIADTRDVEALLDAARLYLTHPAEPTGKAAPPRRDLLTDVRGIWFAGESWMSWQAIAAQLRAQMPEHYADATADTVSAQLRARGVPSVNGHRRGRVLKGAKADAVDEAIRRHKQGR